jgi:hypothetical protein
MQRLRVTLVCVALLATSWPALAQETAGQRILEQRTVTLSISGSSRSGSCMGFRLYREDFPSDVDLILTAGHCFTELGEISLVTVATLAGQTGRGLYRLVWEGLDIAFMLARPKLGPLDPIRSWWPDPPDSLPVFAMIRVGGGTPTIASGWVLGREGNNVNLVLPAAPGSSGGGVVDRSGALVGIIRSGRTLVRGGASPFVQAVGADLIIRLLDQERDRIATIARELSGSASPPPAAAAPIPTPRPTIAPTPAPTLAPAPSPTGPSGPTSTDDSLILPGVGIGRLRLGMTIEEATRVMGPAEGSGRTTTGRVAWTWAAPGPEVYYRPRIVAFARALDSRIDEIQTTSTAFATARGNRVGSRLDGFTVEFGPRIPSGNLGDLPVTSWPGLFVAWDAPLDASTGQRIYRVVLVGVR